MSAPIRAEFTSDALELDLWQVAETGDLEQLQTILAQDGDLNATNEAGATPLMVAAYHGQLEMVRALAGKGAALNAKDRDGFTAAMLAESRGHKDIVRTLVARGATIPMGRGADSSPVNSSKEMFDSGDECGGTPAATVPEVKTLHEPPDIWDLVPEAHDKPGATTALIRGVTAINPLVLVILVLIAGGGAVLGYLGLSGKFSGFGEDAPVVSSQTGLDNTKTVSNTASTEGDESSPLPKPARQHALPRKKTKDADVTVARVKPDNLSTLHDVAVASVTAERVSAPAALFAESWAPKPRRQSARDTTYHPSARKGRTQTSLTSGFGSDDEKRANPTVAKTQPERAPSQTVSAPPQPKPKVIQWP